MEKVFGGNPITITETAEVPISIYAPDVLLKTQENKNFPHHTKHAHTKKKKNPFNQNQQEYNFKPEKGYFVLHFLSLSFIFSGSKRRTKNKTHGKSSEKEKVK